MSAVRTISIARIKIADTDKTHDGVYLGAANAKEVVQKLKDAGFEIVKKDQSRPAS